METKKGSSLTIRRRFQLCRLLFFQKFVAFGRSNFKEADSECPNGLRNFFFYHGFADLLRHILCPNLQFRTPLSILT